MFKKIKNAVKKFFYETFRPRTAEDYRAVLANGTGEKFPWLYLRAFALLLPIYLGVIIAYSTTSSDVFSIEELALFGSAMFSVVWVLLVYECFRKSDVGFLLYSASFLAGGMLSAVFTILVSDRLYGIPLPEWFGSLFLGEIAEESAKGIIAIALILIFKKKRPTDGIRIGAAVGLGFAFFENIGYNAFYGGWRVAEHIDVTFGRGINDILTHAAWTVLICFVFCKVKKPWKNIGFYIAIAVSVFCHAVWNSSAEQDVLPYFFGTVFYAALSRGILIVLAIAEWFALIYLENKQPVPEKGQDDAAESGQSDAPQEDGENPEQPEPVREPFSLNHIRRLSLVLSVTLICGCAIAVFRCIGNDNVKKETITELGTVEEFISVEQSGYDIEADLSRKFDPNAVCLSEHFENGIPVEAVQEEKCGDFGVLEYTYMYNGNSDRWYLTDVKFKLIAEDVLFLSEPEETLLVYLEPIETDITINIVFPKDSGREIPEDLGRLAKLEKGKDYISFFSVLKVSGDSGEFDLSKYYTYRYSKVYYEEGCVYGRSTQVIFRNTYPTVCWVFMGIGAGIAVAETVLFIIITVKKKKKESSLPDC